MDLEQHTVMITGAAGHLGRAVSELFAERGARRVLVVRDAAAFTAGAAPDPRQVVAGADLLDEAQVQAALQTAVQAFGGVDVLCHLAGGFAMGPAVHETPDAAWERMLDLNLRSFLVATRVVVPHLLARGGGRIVAVGAAAALKGAAGMGAYVASKSALVRVVESMAAELREHGVNVNCVLPTLIDTPENRAAMPEADPARWVAPRALAEVVAFLASDAARAVHGAALPVSGLS